MHLNRTKPALLTCFRIGNGGSIKTTDKDQRRETRMPPKEKKTANKPAPATTPPDLENGDSFTGVTLENLSLEAADLSEKVFAQCTFRNCKLPESRWCKSRLEDCVFEG